METNIMAVYINESCYFGYTDSFTLFAGYFVNTGESMKLPDRISFGFYFYKHYYTRQVKTLSTIDTFRYLIHSVSFSPPPER